MKGSTVNNVGSIIRRDETDEAIFDLRFKGIEHYHHYTSIREFIRDWRDYDDYVKEEIEPLMRPKSEARRRIDLFLARTKHIPTDKRGFDAWKANDGIYQKKETK